jgi:hypothetical protein
MATTLTLARARTATGVERRLAGVLLFILAAGFMTAIMAAASMAPGYDIGGGAISDLGVIPETAVLFNLSLVAVGALNLAGGILLYRSDGRAWLLVIYALAGIGAAGAGRRAAGIDNARYEDVAAHVSDRPRWRAANGCVRTRRSGRDAMRLGRPLSRA